MDRKLIFLDIDGTLTEPGKNEPPASALEAVKQAQKQGHLVFLCTGRNYDMLSPLLKYGFDGLIGSSGGYIEYQGKMIYDCPMTASQQKLAMEVLERNGIYRTIEGKNGSYTDEGFKNFLRNHASQGANSELLRWREQIEKSLNIRPMSEYDGEPIYKIVLMLQREDQLLEPRRVLGEDFDFCIQEMSNFGIINGELVNRQFDKGRGVERVCRYLGASLADTIGFGDSMNDREMMETVGLAICMDNGAEALKAMAHEICPAVTEDGIYKAFEKHHLLG